MPHGSRPSAVQVWFTSTEGLSAAEVDSAREVLSADERARADRLRRADDRRDFTIAHFLLRHCLSRTGELAPGAWIFERMPAGKPRLAGGSRPELNLAHTRGLVACAIGDTEVGVDVERVGAPPRRHALVERSLAPAERAWLAGDADEESGVRFLELWTLKEAFLKAAGVGLGLPLDSFAFDLSRAGAIAFAAPPGFRAGDWRFALFEPVPHARLAVAVRAEHPADFVVHRFVTGRSEEDALPLAPLGLSR